MVRVEESGSMNHSHHNDTISPNAKNEAIVPKDEMAIIRAHLWPLRNGFETLRENRQILYFPAKAMNPLRGSLWVSACDMVPDCANVLFSFESDFDGESFWHWIARSTVL
jgi:hypothetical protein